eukprot:COSAG02_NODE_23992_length_701_cov_1.440199_1_plen_156_part_10
MQPRATIKAQQEWMRGACADGRIVRPNASLRLVPAAPADLEVVVQSEEGRHAIEEGVAPAEKNDEVFTPVASPGQSGSRETGQACSIGTKHITPKGRENDTLGRTLTDIRSRNKAALSGISKANTLVVMLSESQQRHERALSIERQRHEVELQESM